LSLNSLKLYKEIAISKKKNNKALHIAFIHWGKNYGKVSKKKIKKANALLDSGTDLIIGQGAHLLQKVEKINNKWVFYNIGNFIFPSPGRYEKLKAHPYSFILSLEQNKVKAYPIYSNNKKSKYQPFFMNKGNLKQIQKIAFPEFTNIQKGSDEFGAYFEVKL
jgi:poly-gamma-glutamate capsule biosynthesis protein CapA/YwtB (metallophosphatase superfamily)